LLGDRVERRAVLDPEASVALDEVVEQLGPDRPPAADVGVVGRHVRQPLRASVGHQDDGGFHAGNATAGSVAGDAKTSQLPPSSWPGLARRSDWKAAMYAATPRAASTIAP